MAAIVGLGDVTAKAETVETEPKIDKVNGTESMSSNGESVVKDNGKCENGGKAVEEPNSVSKVATGQEEEAKKDEVAVDIEPKTGVSFPFKLDDGKQLGCVGLKKKSMLGMGIKLYEFGIYADNEKLRERLKLKIGKAPAKPTKDMYQLVIDSDAEMMVRLVILFSRPTMNMVRKHFGEVLGASIKKLTGGKKNEALANKVMGQASDEIKLTSGSVIEISRLPGNILQTKVIGEVVSKVESELLCRAHVNMYLGDDPLDKDAKEKFGMSLLSLF